MSQNKWKLNFSRVTKSIANRDRFSKENIFYILKGSVTIGTNISFGYQSRMDVIERDPETFIIHTFGLLITFK